MKWLELKIPPVLLVVIIGSLMWLFSQQYYVVRVTFSYQQTAALICILFGGLVIALGVLGFRRQDTTVNPTAPGQASHLVTSGVYGISRNPMYLGMLLWLVGLAVYLFTLTSWLCVPLFVFYMNKFQIRPEERILTNMFGQDYTDYLMRVRRWI